jgi:hypothetical protein
VPDTRSSIDRTRLKLDASGAASEDEPRADVESAFASLDAN